MDCSLLCPGRRVVWFVRGERLDGAFVCGVVWFYRTDEQLVTMFMQDTGCRLLAWKGCATFTKTKRIIPAQLQSRCEI